MAKLTPELKNKISQLSKQELEKLVTKAAGSSKSFYDYLILNYIDKDSGEDELFEEKMNEIESIIDSLYLGRIPEEDYAQMFADCNKEIASFAKVCKRKNLELDLIMFVLKKAFSISHKHYETCFTKINYQVYLLTKKAINLLNTKLHEDYRIQYVPTLNEYLHFLHTYSNHLNYVFYLPQSL